MKVHWGKRLSVLTAAILLLQLLLLGSAGLAAGSISWGEVKSATYGQLQDTILMDKNELYAGGYVLSTNSVSTDKTKADFVINTYGDLGAAGVLELKEDLQAATPVPSGVLGTSVRLKTGGVYLVSLHDASYAKLRIDRLSSSKVMFSYVLEKASAPAADSTTPATPSIEKTMTLEEGGVGLKWQAAQGEAGWDIYRADSGNGGGFVRLNDFRLTETVYVDAYALAGHTYIYKYVSYDAAGNKRSESGLYQVNVVKAGTLTDTGTTASGVKIVMQLDNKKASINGKPYTLSTAPTLLNGSTMVPVRFVSEALGAKVEWYGDTQKIIIRLGSDQVALWVNSVEAQVNGQTVYMTTPAAIVGDSTMVPVRFVSENLRKKVEFVNDTHEIIITDGDGSAPVEKQQPVQEPEKTEPSSEQPAADVSSFYFHIWQLAIPGSYYESNGEVVTSVGALSGGLQINSDGTYYWNSTWDGRLIEGKWVSGDADYPIMLLNAQEGLNWKVGKMNDGSGIYVWNGGSIYYAGYAVD